MLHDFEEFQLSLYDFFVPGICYCFRLYRCFHNY